MAGACGLPLQATRPCGLRPTPMPESSGCHRNADSRSRQADPWTSSSCQGAPRCQEDKEITEVERAENFASRFENLTINPHNNLRITRILHSLGKLGAEEYQVPLVRFFLKEILIKNRLPRMKKSAMNFSIPPVRDSQDRQDLLFFAWRYYFPKEEFTWGNHGELARYKPKPVVAALLPAPLSEWTPVYSEKEKKWPTEEPGGYGEDGWFQMENGRIVLPATLAPEIVRALHASTHGGREMMEQQLEPHFYVPGLSAICKATAQQCVTSCPNCTNNAGKVDISHIWNGTHPVMENRTMWRQKREVSSEILPRGHLLVQFKYEYAKKSGQKACWVCSRMHPETIHIPFASVPMNLSMFASGNITIHSFRPPREQPEMYEAGYPIIGYIYPPEWCFQIGPDRDTHKKEGCYSSKFNWTS
uniref:Uncharacterized protein n=1 Tax=Leptobrachium leishanense TaxID=445787 RepID=A0A8C5QC35_9ANUR